MTELTTGTAQTRERYQAISAPEPLAASIRQETVVHTARRRKHWPLLIPTAVLASIGALLLVSPINDTPSTVPNTLPLPMTISLNTPDRPSGPSLALGKIQSPATLATPNRPNRAPQKAPDETSVDTAQLPLLENTDAHA